MLHFIRTRLTAVPPLPANLNLEGKTALVTGANIGLGFECCRLFLKLGVKRLIMAVRSLDKGEAAATRLRPEFPKDSEILVWQIDMESLSSVEAFATRCERELPVDERLHVVVLNAGTAKEAFKRVDHEPYHEVTIQVNYLSTVLLGILLLPKLKPSSSDANEEPGRLTLIGTDSALGVMLDDPDEMGLLNSVQQQDNYDGFRQYSISKLLLTMFVARLADMIDPSKVIVNTCNPGPTKGTGFFNSLESPILRAVVQTLSSIFGRPVVDAARTYVHASLVLGKESHGSYAEWIVRP